MKKLYTSFAYFLIIALTATCIEPYYPPQIDNTTSYLVVNAFLDSDKGEGSVILSKTVALDQPNISPVETAAKVNIEIESGSVFSFQETTGGTYTISGITIGEQRCRIRIVTKAGREYLSDYATSKKSPPIDSVTYVVTEADGLKISVTTHDPNKQALFYRWRFEQTGLYTSEYESIVYYNPDRKDVFSRDTPNLKIFACYKTDLSSQLLIATTKGLSEDAIEKFPIVSYSLSEWVYKLRYSILVKQYAMDEAEYTYWNELKKITESVGTIFDPQPSMIQGNLHSLTSVDEPVLGYFSVSAVAEKRIFIDGKTLPLYTYTTPYKGFCADPTDTISLKDFYKDPTSVLIIKGVYTISGTLIGYETTKPLCIDCRILVGGTNIKPDFWE